MQVIPVLDILDGVVVRGVAGRRQEYSPIVSRLTTSCEPIAVANAIRDEFGLNHFYVADLDGILKRRPNETLYQSLMADDFRLLIDPGIRDASEAARIHEATGAQVIVGLETCETPDDLSQIAAILPDLTFSLDLQAGIPRVGRNDGTAAECGDAHGCWSDRADGILRQVIHRKVTSIIILDLSDVGMGTGGSTDRLCRFARAEFPGIHLITGGGVRDRNDLKRLIDLGVDAALVASALHDGRLCRDDLR